MRSATRVMYSQARSFSSTPQKQQHHLLVYGAPGVGKGTYAKLIEKEFDFKTFSMGEYFRQIIKQEVTQSDPFIQKIKNILKSGQLVDDETVIDVVKKIHRDPQYAEKRGIIFDGIPRTINQAEKLKEICRVDLLLNFFNREEILIKKLTSRRVCPSCDKNYNLADINTDDGYKMKPLLPKKDISKCDKCDVELVKREDDKERVIKDRMELYQRETKPILDFYKTKTDTKVIDYEAKKGIDEFPHVRDIIKRELKI